jgi:hypothetical protein
LVAQWDYDKNIDCPSDISAGSNKMKNWSCNKAPDHKWIARASDRTGKHGCPCCSGKKIVLSNCLATTHPTIASQLHPTLNDVFTAYNIGAGSNKKPYWQCEKNPDHAWTARVSDRVKGRGCPICNEYKGEKIIREYLEKNSIYFKSQYKFKKFFGIFDFVVKHSNFTGILEFNGEQHYYPVSFGSKKPDADLVKLIDNIKRDHRKIRTCKKQKIPLFIIPYWDRDRIQEILDDLFNGKIPTFSKPSKEVKNCEMKRKQIRIENNIFDPEILYGLI